MTTRTSAEFDWRRFLTVGLQMALIIAVTLLVRLAASWLWVHAPLWIPVAVHDTTITLIEWTGVALAILYGVIRTR